MNSCLPAVLPTLVALLLTMPPAARAADQAVTFRVLCLEHREGLTKALVSSERAREAVEVALLTAAFTEPLTATFANGMAAFHVKDPEAPGKRRVVATGKLADGEQQLLLFLPDETGEHPYRILAMNEDEKSFPMGAVRILNLCDKAIRLDRAGTIEKPIAPQGLGLYPPFKTDDEWGMYQVGLEMDLGKDKWANFLRTSWKSSALKRDLIVLRLDPRSRQVNLFTYKDIPPWRKPNLEQE